MGQKVVARAQQKANLSCNVRNARSLDTLPRIARPICPAIKVRRARARECSVSHAMDLDTNRTSALLVVPSGSGEARTVKCAGFCRSPVARGCFAFAGVGAVVRGGSAEWSAATGRQ